MCAVKKHHSVDFTEETKISSKVVEENLDG